MNRKRFIIIIFGVFLTLRRRVSLLLKKDSSIDENSLATDDRRLG